MHNTVYEAYRLRPRDLDGPRATAIRRVTYEGVEELRPVLYFEGLPKPLVLSGEQARALTRWTGEALCERWIGHAVVLSPAEGGILLGQASAEPPHRQTGRPALSMPPVLADALPQRRHRQRAIGGLDSVAASSYTGAALSHCRPG